MLDLKDFVNNLTTEVSLLLHIEQATDSSETAVLNRLISSPTEKILYKAHIVCMTIQTVYTPRKGLTL